MKVATLVTILIIGVVIAAFTRRGAVYGRTRRNRALSLAGLMVVAVALGAVGGTLWAVLS